jgi:23S rRNA pseudouridine2605 synthase
MTHEDVVGEQDLLRAVDALGLLAIARRPEKLSDLRRLQSVFQSVDCFYYSISTHLISPFVKNQFDNYSKLKEAKMRSGQDTHNTEDLPAERIAKTIARSGLCSRRDAERLIGEGRVSLNGKRLESPAVNVKPGDRIVVDGKPLPAIEPPRLWRYHKPKGRVTTHRDPQGRPTVFAALPQEMPRVISIGRLDFNTEGLLLLTNDGELARHLETPATGWMRRYRVRAHGRVEQAALDRLADGTQIDGVRYGPVEAKIERVQGTNIWLNIGLREGKNREVRKILETLGLTVNRLIRISFGPFILGDLETGAVEEVKKRILVEQLGTKTSQTLGLTDKKPGKSGDSPKTDASAPPAGKPKRRPSRPAPARKRGAPGSGAKPGAGRPAR